jgi:hypothetical protein
LNRLVKEPLLHFLVLGAVLFGLFNLFGGRDEAEAPARIVISEARIANLANGFARTWQRPPTRQEMQDLVEDYIREEVFYREGRALGLDRDDVIVRRRIRQKLEFMVEDIGTTEPSEEQLAAHLAAHPERFRSEDRLTFRHVFLSASRRTDLEDDAERLAAELASENAETDVAALGDPFLLGEAFRAMPLSDIARLFGERFAEGLAAVEPGRWQGPVSSGYGLHFVVVSERLPGGLPPLAAVLQAVRQEWLNERRIEAQQKLYSALRERYEIVVETPPDERTAMWGQAGSIR